MRWQKIRIKKLVHTSLPKIYNFIFNNSLEKSIEFQLSNEEWKKY